MSLDCMSASCRKGLFSRIKILRNVKQGSQSLSHSAIDLEIEKANGDT